MEFDFRILDNDPTERRRLQNRLAQRKFRLKKAADGNDHPDSSSRPNACTSRRQAQAQATSDASASDFLTLASPLTSMSNTANMSMTLPETNHMGFDPDVNFADLQGMDSFFRQDFDFISSGSSRTSPSSSTSLNRSALLQSVSDVTVSSSSGTPQDQQHCLIPYTARSCSDVTQPAALPPPRDQPLFESRPEENLRILSTAPPSEASDGWVGTLHIAAQKGHDGIVRTLLQHGNVECNERDSDERTPLMYAVAEGHEAVVRSLLSHGARIAEVDRDRRSALHLAVLHRRESVLRVLLAQHEDGLSIDGYDVAGWTPLHMAVDRDFEAGMVLLLQSGANLQSKARKCPFSGTIML